MHCLYSMVLRFFLFSPDFFFFGSSAGINLVQITECGCSSLAISSAETSPSFSCLSVHMELQLVVLPISR